MKLFDVLVFHYLLLNHRHTHHIKISVVVTFETPHQSEVLCDSGFGPLCTTNDRGK